MFPANSAKFGYINAFALTWIYSCTHTLMHTWQTLSISPLNVIKCSHSVNPAPTHTSFIVACSREQGNFVNIPTKEEVYFFALTLLKKGFRTEMKRLCFTVPKNAVKCLVFTVLAKPFKRLSIMWARRCKRKRRSWGEEWMIKFSKKRQMRWRDGRAESW